MLVEPCCHLLGDEPVFYTCLWSGLAANIFVVFLFKMSHEWRKQYESLLSVLFEIIVGILS